MVSTELCTSLLASAGRVCALPAGHPEQRHRNGEISWTDEMAAAETVADLEAKLARFEELLARQPGHVHAQLMILALSHEIALRQPLGHRCSTHAIRACTICTPAGVA
jgi:hypothetical protein